MKRPLLFLCALLGTVSAQTVSAQTASPLKLLLTQNLVTVVTENGKTSEKLTPSPKSVQPGDTLTQQVSVSNVGKTPLKNAGINVPVPRGTFYLGNTDLGGAPGTNRWQAQYSSDGGKTFGSAPLLKTVAVVENGKSVQKQVVVPPSEYTNVRWLIATLQPDETLKLGFRVKVK